MAITGLFCTGWEHQNLATSTTALGAPATTVTGTGVTIATAGMRTGSACLSIARPAATATLWQRQWAATQNKVVARVYIKCTSAPGTANTDHILVQAIGIASQFPQLTFRSDLTLRVGFNAVGVQNLVGTMVLNQWHLVELQVDTSTNPHTIAARLDGGTIVTNTNAVAAATQTGLNFGVNGTGGGAWTCLFDDYVAGSYTGTTGANPGDWFGAGEVRALRPAGVGSHSLGTDTYQKTGAVNITAADTTSQAEIDDAALGTGTDFVSQTLPAAPAGTTYLEHVLDQLAADVSAVDHVAVYTSVANASATTANVWRVGIYDPGTATRSDAFSGSIGSASQVIRGGQFSARPGVVAWDRASVNALRLRQGFSTDASPVPQTHAVVVEVAVDVSAPAATIPGPPLAAQAA